MYRKIKIACVGDSITQGLGNIPYPTRLSELLGKNYDVVNFGLWGTTVCDGSGRTYTTVEDTKYPSSLAYNPDVVILMLGTNDGNPNTIDKARACFKDELKSIIYSYLELPSSPKLYLLTSPYAFNENNRFVNSDIAQLQRDIAKELSLPLLDMNSITKNLPEYFQDGLHFNDTGYLYLAQCIHDFVFNKENKILQDGII